MDKLEHIFQLQKGLNARIGVHTDDMDEKQRVEWLLNYSRALSQETAELVDSVPWKWWAKYQTVDMQNVRVEIVDIIHFVVSLALSAGMTADDVHQIYCAKNKVNHNRQDSGYTVKNESDSKDIGK